MLRTIGYVLNVKDVIQEAHSTFMKDKAKLEEEHQSQA